MATQRVSNIFAYEAVHLQFDDIPDQVVEINVPVEIDLNDYLPEGFTYTFGFKTGTSLPTNFSLNTMTGIVSGTAMTAFDAQNVVFTATTDGITVESNEVNYSVSITALWTDADGNALWTDADSIPLWTGMVA